MNLIRCSRCGQENSVADEAGVRCARCGQDLTAAPTDAIDATATAVFSDVADFTVGAPPATGDTDDNTAHMKTISSPAPGLVTGGPAKACYAAPPGAELYDFLAPPQQPDEIGRLGPYRVLRVLGAGGMGVVYEAEDAALQRRVALKAMLPTLAASAAAKQRFLREARTAAAVEHERIVAIFQVGEERGIPYLVMPLLKGESLEARLNRDGRLPLEETVRIGREIAEALAAAHERGLIHRDVKPANVWLEGDRAKVKLLDFGLARAIETDSPLTQQGSIVGTPAFMAPEQATGETIDARCDLFSLGCVLYRMSTGTLPFRGVSAISILMEIVRTDPLAPLALTPDLPPALSALTMQLLAKKPADRPANASAVMAALDAISPPGSGVRPPLPPGPPTAAGRAVAPPPSGGRTSARFGTRSIVLAVAGFAIVGIGGTLLIPPLFKRDEPNPNPGPIVPASTEIVEIGITYGTEKEAWFRAAVKDFAAAPEGKNIKVNLLPMGSVEGGQAVSKHADERIHVWSPASSLYKDAFVQEWQAKHPGHDPILKSEPLALTPMVFVFWQERHDAYIAKYKTVSFATIADAMQQPQGWGDIAGKPDWGRFRFGHTNPAESNSGLMTLLLLACELNKDAPLTAASLSDAALQKQLGIIERGLAGTSNSTGNLMKQMVTKGPSAFDAVIVYESLTIDYLKAARGRWGDLKVAYPRRNLWSENPYYILDVPWSSKDQRQAAEVFLRFLLSEPAQKKALEHGFRPVNIDIPITNSPDSPFVRYKDRGLLVNPGAICEPPANAVVDLMRAWRQSKQ